MKNLLILALVATVSFSASAQVTQSVSSGDPYGKGAVFTLVQGDTLTNVDTVFKVLQTTAGYRDISIFCTANKLSGTLTGKLILLGSTDGINFLPTDSASYATLVTTSKQAPTGTNGATIWKTGAPYQFWEIMATSTTTVSAPVTIRYVLRKTTVVQSY